MIRSGVFFCNSRAISGLKLDFSSSWGVVKNIEWVIFGWHVGNILETCMGNIWMICVIFGLFLDEIWAIYGWFEGDISMIRGWNLDDMWVWFLDDMWMRSRWYVYDIHTDIIQMISPTYHPDTTNPIQYSSSQIHPIIPPSVII